MFKFDKVYKEDTEQQCLYNNSIKSVFENSIKFGKSAGIVLFGSSRYFYKFLQE